MLAASASTLASARARTPAMRIWQAAAIVGISVFAAHALLGDRGGLDDFFNRYWYNGLILLAVLAGIVRAVTSRSERGAWIAFAVGMSCWAVAEILFDFVYS